MNSSTLKTVSGFLSQLQKADEYTLVVYLENIMTHQEGPSKECNLTYLATQYSLIIIQIKHTLFSETIIPRVF